MSRAFAEPDQLARHRLAELVRAVEWLIQHPHPEVLRRVDRRREKWAALPRSWRRRAIEQRDRDQDEEW